MKRPPVPATTLLWGCLLLAFTGCATVRQSNTELRAQLLAWAPVGSDKTTALAVIHTHFPKSRAIVAKANDGRARIAAKLGSYHALRHFPFQTGVFAVWQFSADGTLTDIDISREVDGL